MITREEWNGYSPDEQFEWARAMKYLLEDRELLLKEIPGCPRHGKECVPHALGWIKDAIAFLKQHHPGHVLLLDPYPDDASEMRRPVGGYSDELRQQTLSDVADAIRRGVDD